jgi:hypothetical protein
VQTSLEASESAIRSMLADWQRQFKHASREEPHQSSGAGACAGGAAASGAPRAAGALIAAARATLQQATALELRTHEAVEVGP